MAPKDRALSEDDYNSQQHMNGSFDSSDPPLSALFDNSYLRAPMTPLKWTLLILWAPFGTVLSILRILLTVIVCSYAVISEKFFPALSPSDKKCVYR